MLQSRAIAFYNLQIRAYTAPLLEKTVVISNRLHADITWFIDVQNKNHCYAYDSHCPHFFPAGDQAVLNLMHQWPWGCMGLYVHFVHDSDARCAFHHYWERTLYHTDSRGSAKQWIAIFRVTQHGQYIQCHIIPTIWEVGKLVIFEFMTMMSRSIPGCFYGLLKMKFCLSVQLIILFFCYFTIIIIIGIRCELIDKGSVAIRYKYQRPTQQCECYAEGVIYHQKTFICYWNIILLICWWS